MRTALLFLAFLAVATAFMAPAARPSVQVSAIERKFGNAFFPDQRRHRWDSEPLLWHPSFQYVVLRVSYVFIDVAFPLMYQPWSLKRLQKPKNIEKLCTDTLEGVASLSISNLSLSHPAKSLPIF